MIVRLRIRFLIFMRLTAERDTLMRFYSWSLPYLWLSLRLPAGYLLSIRSISRMFLKFPNSLRYCNSVKKALKRNTVSATDIWLFGIWCVSLIEVTMQNFRFLFLTETDVLFKDSCSKGIMYTFFLYKQKC